MDQGAAAEGRGGVAGVAQLGHVAVPASGRVWQGSKYRLKHHATGQEMALPRGSLVQDKAVLSLPADRSIMWDGPRPP